MIDPRDEGGDPACWAHLFPGPEADIADGDETVADDRGSDDRGSDVGGSDDGGSGGAPSRPQHPS